MTSDPQPAGPPTPESEPALFGLLDAAQTAALMLDADGTILVSNRSANEMFGFPPGALVGQPLDRLAVDEAVEGPSLRHRSMLDAVASGVGVYRVVRASRGDGAEIEVEAGVTPIPTEQGTWLLLDLRDVTAARADKANLVVLTHYYRLLAAVNQVIVVAEDEDALYESLCAALVEAGGFAGSGIGQVMADRGIKVTHAAGWTEAFRDRVLASVDPTAPGSHSPMAKALRDGESTWVFDLDADPSFDQWRPIIEEYGLRSSFTVPLRCRGANVAALSMTADRDLELDPVLEELLPLIGANVEVALDNLATRAQLSATSQDLARLLERMVVAQDEERAAIAADLHDEPVQQLAALDLHLGLLARRLDTRAPELLRQDVAEMQAIVSAVTRDLRDLLFELEPADQSAPLVEVLRRNAEHLLTGSDIALSVAQTREGAGQSGAAWQCPPHVRTQVVRILNEAVRNVRRHARATRAEVALSVSQDGLRLVIADDGVGLDEEESSRPGHRGLATMHDRAALVGGTLTVQSGDQGTALRLTIPRRPDGSLTTRA